MYKSDLPVGQTLSSVDDKRVGQTVCIDDPILGGNDRKMIVARSGRKVTLRLVKNASGGVLLPGYGVRYTAGARLKEIAGTVNANDGDFAGVVDPLLPASGVPSGHYFYVVEEGPTKVQTAASNYDAAITIGSVFGFASGGTLKAAADADATNAAGWTEVAIATTDINLKVEVVLRKR